MLGAVQEDQGTQKGVGGKAIFDGIGDFRMMKMKINKYIIIPIYIHRSI